MTPALLPVDLSQHKKRTLHGMKIAHRKIGPAEPPLVIAEIGINHGGSLDVAKHMVSLAARSGCEIVKHQTHFVED